MSPDTAYPWSALGLAEMPADAAEIRRAYARALKQIDQATDMAGFTALRAAYEVALAMRAGRSKQTAQRRAAEPTNKATETPVPNTPQTIAEPTPRPAIAAAKKAQLQQSQMLEELIQNLFNAHYFGPAEQRIFELLANAASAAPETAPQIRAALAQFLRSMLRPSEDSFTLSPQITVESLHALDQRYGWLSDYAAFQQDFGGNTQMLDLLTTRAFGDFSQRTARQVPVAKPKSIPPGIMLMIVIVTLAAALKFAAMSSTETQLSNLHSLLDRCNFEESTKQLDCLNALLAAEHRRIERRVQALHPDLYGNASFPR